MTYDVGLPGLEAESIRGDDIVLTPLDVAKDVVEFFKPSGRILDPCRGNGAFSDIMECEWCEIREGRDFYAWTQPVDWIVSNPPYSVFSEFLRHSFTVAENIVYLIPINKVFNSTKMIRDVWNWGGRSDYLRSGQRRRTRIPNRIRHRRGALQARIHRRNKDRLPDLTLTVRRENIVSNTMFTVVVSEHIGTETVEVFRSTRPSLDVPAVIEAVFKQPRAKRSDAGKTRKPKPEQQPELV